MKYGRLSFWSSKGLVKQFFLWVVGEVNRDDSCMFVEEA